MNHIFDAPIPGQSLTQPVGAKGLPGSSPYEKPSQFNNLDEALNYTWEKFTTKDGAMQIHLMLRKNIPVEYICDTMLFEGCAQGVFNVDLACLMKPTVMRQIAAVGHLSGVTNPKILKPRPEKDDFLSNFTDLLNTDKPELKPTLFTGLTNG